MIKILNINNDKINFTSSNNAITNNQVKISANTFTPPLDNYGKVLVKGGAMTNQNKYINLRDKFCEQLEPKSIDLEHKAWNFYINSSDENLEKMTKSEDAVQELFKNEELYFSLKEIKHDGLKDKHLNKQLNDLYKSFDEELNAGELKKELREKENQIAAKNNSYIPQIDDKETTKAEISKILENEKDVSLRKKAYEAKIKGGDLIANDLVEFVKLRNKFAKTQGYDNFFDYQLKEEYDVDIVYLNTLLDSVSNNVKDMSKTLQEKNKKELAKEYGIPVKDLKAYHYGLILDSNPQKEINKSFKNKEQIVDIAKKTYANMGYDIDCMPITLDLFPRKNKNTHGFCFEIEPGKDSRILANLTNNSNSLDTLCHELGHCVYNLGIDTKLPYLDKGTYPAMTEAVAMMMGDLQQRENILKDYVSGDKLDKFKNDFKNSEVKFINRSMLIIEFEREMYKNPDQDLSQLWHDLKCKYLDKNESEDKDNEWATIPHYLSHPAYYQNYFRADLIKAQMYKHLTKTLGNLTENKNTSEYLKNNLFKFGQSFDENELIENFTGEKLSSDALIESINN